MRTKTKKLRRKGTKKTRAEKAIYALEVVRIDLLENIDSDQFDSLDRAITTLLPMLQDYVKSLGRRKAIDKNTI